MLSSHVRLKCYFTYCINRLKRVGLQPEMLGSSTGLLHAVLFWSRILCFTEHLLQGREILTSRVDNISSVSLPSVYTWHWQHSRKSQWTLIVRLAHCFGRRVCRLSVYLSVRRQISRTTRDIYARNYVTFIRNRGLRARIWRQILHRK